MTSAELPYAQLECIRISAEGAAEMDGPQRIIFIPHAERAMRAMPRMMVMMGRSAAEPRRSSHDPPALVRPRSQPEENAQAGLS
jgi:hypothetical protein